MTASCTSMDRQQILWVSCCSHVWDRWVAVQLLNWTALPYLCLVYVAMGAFCSSPIASRRVTEMMKQTRNRAVLLPEVNLVSGALILWFYSCKTRPDRIRVGLKTPRLGIDKRNGSEQNWQNFLSYCVTHFCWYICSNYKSRFTMLCEYVITYRLQKCARTVDFRIKFKVFFLSWPFRYQKICIVGSESGNVTLYYVPRCRSPGTSVALFYVG